MKENVELEKYWSRFENNYDANQEFVAGKELLNIVMKKIRGLNSLGKVLEIGCGTGVFTKVLSQNAEKVLATDYSEKLLEVCKMQLSNESNVITQIENCMGLSISDESFDTVFMANVLHVIEDPIQAMTEMYRVLHSGGQLILTTFTTHGMKKWDAIKMAYRFLKVWGKPPEFTHRFSPDDVAKIAKNTGFDVIQCELIGNRTKSVFLMAKKL